MQEIIYGIVKHEELRISEEKTAHVITRFPFIEFVEEPYSGLKCLEKLPSPRMIKTHLMKEFFGKPLEQKNKIIIVFRNVKDAIVSYYHYYQHVEAFDFKGRDFNEFFELFREKHLCYGDWYDWTLDWWSEKDNPNVCFFFYEDMKADIHKETRRVAKFLGKELTEEQIQFIVGRADFDAMKKQRMAVDKREKEGTGQLRKGIIGDWRSHFSEEQAQYVDKLTAKKLEGTGLQFRDAWIVDLFYMETKLGKYINHDISVSEKPKFLWCQHRRHCCRRLTVDLGLICGITP